jgi:hypothetical protein
MRAANHALWGAIVKKYRATSEGSPPGRWSARKAVLSQLEYEKRGGGWKETPAPEHRPGRSKLHEGSK